MKAAHHEITQALLDAYTGDEAAASRLWAMVYEELQKIAHRELLDERANHTLNTTGLVHEAYVKLVDHTRITWQNRAHFYALACRAMRRILVDYARRRGAQKRGGHDSPLPLEEAMALAEGRSEELVALDEALERLSPAGSLQRARLLPSPHETRRDSTTARRPSRPQAAPRSPFPATWATPPAAETGSWPVSKPNSAPSTSS